MSYRYLFITLLFAVCESSDNAKLNAYKQFYEKLNNKSLYEKLFSPKLGESEAVEVGLTLHALKLDVCTKNKELNLDIYFRQKWTDKRLANDNSPFDIIGKQELVDKIWIPDTFFSSSSSVKVNKYPTPNIFVKITPKGEVLLSHRYQTAVNCIFPTELYEKEVNCTLDVESYAFTANDIVYKWDKGVNSISVSSQVPTDEYTFKGFEGKEKREILSTGNYARLQAEFYFLKNEIKPPIAAGLVAQSIDY